MAIDKQLGTEDNPDVRVQGSAVEIPLDTTREDQIREAAEILVENENLFIDEEIQGTQPQEMDFNSNLVDFLELLLIYLDAVLILCYSFFLLVFFIMVPSYPIMMRMYMLFFTFS